MRLGPATLRGTLHRRVRRTFARITQLGTRPFSCPLCEYAAILACDLRERIFSLQFEPREQFEQRQRKLEQIQALGFDPYPHEFPWTHAVAGLVDKYRDTPGP